jgi:hypothetical protein
VRSAKESSALGEAVNRIIVPPREPSSRIDGFTPGWSRRKRFDETRTRETLLQIR